MPEQMSTEKAALLYTWNLLCDTMRKLPESQEKREAAQIAAWMKSIIDELN